MHLNRKLYALLSLTIILFFAACSGGKETGKDDVEESTPLWNNIVSLDVAEEFVNQLEIESGLRSKPVFLVGKIDVSGDVEEIAAGLEYDIELALVNTGRVNFIRNKKTRDHERENRKGMSVFENDDEFFSYLNRLKVDRYIEGSITADQDGLGSSYVVVLRMLNTDSMEFKEWRKTISSR